MQSLLMLSRFIDRTLRVLALTGGWLGALLVVVVCYDVITRYFGVPKPAGLNSTMIQESEYWLHAYLIMLAVGYGYTRQTHVRIDLLREGFSERRKYWIEIVGICLALVPYSLLGIWLSFGYAKQSFLSGEISKSQTGLSNLWLLKAGMVLLFVLLLLAALSQLIKCIAGLRGDLDEDTRDQLLNGGH
ncbi:TRAP transporter small permease subunit [Oceanomicrobium pacificus]|uniref:TRAP transporter small permease protein n=1 Tax=Oceanomicrobium pacificus TaxID=2692916 RepID=A0A6B0TZC9_9RHOB|nr:TRAP transporter small permease subunit [Oceanomicrobium pacificus]MXU66622.1 TRAP transporter small permease subunit [Oceanomicrobium pacificus]